jgi:hypothetical protein
MIGKSILCTLAKASEIANGITRSQQVLSVWKHKRVTNRYKSAPGPRDTHYVVVQLQDDLTMANSSSAISIFLSFSPIATFLPKSAPGLHPFIATVSMLDWVGKTPLNVTT